ILALGGGQHGIPEALGRAIAAGEDSRIGLADMANAECVDETIERDRPALIDGIEQIPDAGLTPAFALPQRMRGRPVSLLQGEDVEWRFDELIGIKFLDYLLPQAFDIEGVARYKMAQSLDPLGSADEPAGTAPDRIDLTGLLVDVPDRVAAPHRTCFREMIRPGTAWALLGEEGQDLRKDIACPLHDDGIAD